MITVPLLKIFNHISHEASIETMNLSDNGSSAEEWDSKSSTRIRSSNHRAGILLVRVKPSPCFVVLIMTSLLSVAMTVGVLTVHFTSLEQSNAFVCIELNPHARVFCHLGKICRNPHQTILANLTDLDAYPRAVAVGDLNEDGWMDLSTANYLMDTIGIDWNEGRVFFGSPLVSPMGLGTNPSSLSIDDFDEDGHSDVAVTNPGTNFISILFGRANGTLDNAIDSFLGSNADPMEVVVADLNVDHHSDIVVVVHGQRNELSVFSADGEGHIFLVPRLSSVDWREFSFLLSLHR